MQGFSVLVCTPRWRPHAAPRRAGVRGRSEAGEAGVAPCCYQIRGARSAGHRCGGNAGSMLNNESRLKQGSGNRPLVSSLALTHTHTHTHTHTFRKVFFFFKVPTEFESCLRAAVRPRTCPKTRLLLHRFHV